MSVARAAGGTTEFSFAWRNYIFPPLLPSSASSGFCGSCGLEPLPAPAAPPLLIKTRVPEIATPAGPMLMNPPEALMVSSRPASITTFIPALRWISCPASCANFMPVFSLSAWPRSEEHTSELQSRLHLVCRLLLEKKKKKQKNSHFNKNKRQYTRYLS